MAAEIITGLGVIYGIANSGTPITIAGYASFLIESGKITHKFDLDQVKDNNKYDAALIATNGHREIDLTFTPTGATRAATLASSNASMLAPLAKVSLSNFKYTDINGDWVYIGDESIDLTLGVAKMTLRIRKYDDATQNASLVTTVVG